MLKEIGKHVIDDAVELVATLGIATPLLNPYFLHESDEEKRQVYGFLRATLSRHVILVATRLHATRGSGRTGETASIDSYLHYAEIEGALTKAQSDDFRFQRQTVVSKLESEGIPYTDLVTFRNSELAHSLHRTVPFDNKLMSLPIWDFSHDTYELVLTIDRTVFGATTLDKKFHQWLGRGNTFWSTPEDNSDYSLHHEES